MGERRKQTTSKARSISKSFKGLSEICNIYGSYSTWQLRKKKEFTEVIYISKDWPILSVQFHGF